MLSTVVLTRPKSPFISLTEEQIAPYQFLNDHFDHLNRCLITHANGQREEIVFKQMLGRGGAKVAILINNSRALLIPRMDNHPVRKVTSVWARMVEEEVQMSNILKKAHLLCSDCNKVTLSFYNTELTIPGYLSTPFDSLKYTIMGINWKKEEDPLFSESQSRHSLDDWSLLLQELLIDVVNICIHTIPFSKDSAHIAILNNASGKKSLRYFGFDYSSSYNTLDCPSSHTIKDWENFAIREKLLKRADVIFSYLLEIIITHEGEEVEYFNLEGLKTRLVQKNSSSFPKLFEIQFQR